MKIHHWAVVVLVLFTALSFGQDYIVWSGGISDQEREDAPTATTLVFFQEGGSYLSSVDVQTRNTEGREFVDTSTRGPWLILNLPDGEYVVEASRAIRDRARASFEVDKEQSKEVALAFPHVDLPDRAMLGIE